MTWEFGRDLTKPGEDVYIRVFTLGPGQVPPPGFDQVISLNPKETAFLAGSVMELYDDDDDDDGDAFMDALRKRWPEATDDEITRGHNLCVAVAEVAKPN